MSGTDYFKAFTEAWTGTGNVVSDAQQQFFKTIAEQLGKGFVLPFPMTPVGTGADRASDGFRQLFASALEVPESLAKEAAASASGDTITLELLQKVLDPRAWLSSAGYMDEGLRRIVEGPKLADMGTLENKFFAVMKALGESRAAMVEQSVLLLTAWSKAASEFVGRLNKAADGKPLASRQEMVATWVDIANRHFLEVERSADYLANQRKLLRSSSALKLAQRDLSDLYSETFGLPTRTEIDDLTRTVAELKREVRADKRARRKSEGRLA